VVTKAARTMETLQTAQTLPERANLSRGGFVKGIRTQPLCA